jgi:hypothetical protein
MEIFSQNPLTYHIGRYIIKVQFKKGAQAVKEQSEHYCIFEKRICQYAHNVDGVFECNAPSDEEMKCK